MSLTPFMEDTYLTIYFSFDDRAWGSISMYICICTCKLIVGLREEFHGENTKKWDALDTITYKQNPKNSNLHSLNICTLGSSCLNATVYKSKHSTETIYTHNCHTNGNSQHSPSSQYFIQILHMFGKFCHWR